MHGKECVGILSNVYVCLRRVLCLSVGVHVCVCACVRACIHVCELACRLQPGFPGVLGCMTRYTRASLPVKI